MCLAIVGGTGVDEMEAFVSGRVVSISTRFGDAHLVEGQVGERRVLFLPRHGLDHSVPPGQINYRAQMAALKNAGAQQVIGVCAVGSLTQRLSVGAFAVLADFIDLTKHRRDTFFDEPDAPVVHTDFTQPYCPRISRALVEACAECGVAVEPAATYVGVEGPRYETPAEIRLYGSWGGHVIGMTNLPEAVLAREAGLCYGALALVSNLAAGLSPTPLTHDEVRAAVIAGSENLQAVIRSAAARLPEESECACRSGADLIWT